MNIGGCLGSGAVTPLDEIRGEKLPPFLPLHLPLLPVLCFTSGVGTHHNLGVARRQARGFLRERKRTAGSAHGPSSNVAAAQPGHHRPTDGGQR